MDIDIYVIKSDHLKKRNELLVKTLDVICKIMQKYYYNVKIINITTPTIEDIEIMSIERY
jgi:hypothetical protein